MKDFRLTLAACLLTSLAGGCEASDPGTVDLDVVQSPVHDDGQPWQYPQSPDATGQGACTGVKLSAFLGSIRTAFPSVAEIVTFRPGGANGVSQTAPPALPVGTSPPPATGTSSYVTSLMDQQSFAAVFVQGTRCRADACQDHEYWYFETGPGCQPRWVGHHRLDEQVGGRYGTCVDVQGSPIWHLPAPVNPRRRCDADWSAQNISGTRHAASLDALGGCGAASNIVPVDVTITQQTDLSKATFALAGTGIPFIDGRAFSGAVERQSFAALIDETTADACQLHRHIDIRLDFEGPSINGIPGGFGLVEISQAPAGAGCQAATAGCSASLHLVSAGR